MQYAKKIYFGKVAEIFKILTMPFTLKKISTGASQFGLTAIILSNTSIAFEHKTVPFLT